MVMNTFYTEKLYPLQDRVLNTIDTLSLPFYLTGGTALSRCYFNHRYSEDLDFFVNADKDFSRHCSLVIERLQSKFSVEIVVNSSTYVKLMIDSILKVEFVNDVTHHFGNFEKKPLFGLVDNTLNILSNKLSAIIGRDEPKDVVDIWVIAKSGGIDWKHMFTDVGHKASGIFPPEVVRKLETMPLEMLDRIAWVEPRPSYDSISDDIKRICDEILTV
jgi:predicted nucleotidyltransferase component of viral defense system